MPRISEDTKAERQERLLLELRRHPGGLSEAELAALLGLERRTINNYLRELELRGQLYKEEMLWLVDPHSESYRLRHLTISPEQAMTLYLAVRLLVKQHDKRHESAETALLKLAEALTEEWGVGDEIRQAARELAERPGDQSYSRVFREVVRGYVYRRAIRINYVPRHRRPFQATLYPYLLEPWLQ
jgi:predicted DNA-binding transcriptional regulator YafY